MYEETPGLRIREKRDQLGISQAQLASLVGLNAKAINRIEVGTLPINMIVDYLPQIAAELKTTVDYIKDGELRSERSTREELRRMREEGVIRSDEELKRLDELAAESIRQRNKANIPLNRMELEYLLDVIRGTDGY